MTIERMREQLTELQRQENKAHEQMRRCEDDYWPDRYPDARDKYHAVLAKVDALIDKLKDAEAQLLKLWDDLGNVPTNSDDEIETAFLQFPVGTNVSAIWYWIEQEHGVKVSDLIYGTLHEGGE